MSQKSSKPQSEASNMTMAYQLLVVLQGALGTVISSAILYGGYRYCPSLPYPATDDPASKLTYALRCCFPPAMTIIWAVIAVIGGRRSKKVGNPLSGKEDLLQLEKNILTNTLEQFVIFFVTCLVMSTYLSGPEMRLVPLYATAFTIGRVLFNIGYRVKWSYRSLGFTTNVSSSTIVIVYTVYLMATQGFFFGMEVITSNVTASGGKNEL